jgi:DNA-binding CsgD family transcriptional regulator
MRDLGRAISSPEDADGLYALQTYMVRREAARLEPIRALMSGTERPTDLWAPGLLAVYTELGLVDPARRILQWLLTEGIENYEPSADWPATLTFMTEAALLLEDDTVAQELRPRLLEYAGQNLSAGPFAAAFGSADRYLGSVDSLLGHRGAADWFGSALAMDTRMSAPVHVAETLAAETLHLRRVGAPSRRVAGMVQRVREVAEPLGIQRALRIVGVEPPPVGCVEPVRPDGLTAREVETLQLLAAGLSNREIARRLVISPSTAANHVRSILLKTGSANRTQAARYAHQHDLVSG